MTRRTDPIWDDDDVDVLVGLGILIALSLTGGVAIVFGGSAAWTCGIVMAAAAVMRTLAAMTRVWKRTA